MAHAAPEDWRPRARAELVRARERTLGLLRPLDEATLTRQHSPLMSPLVWDLAHVANYEEQWLLRTAGAPPLVRPELDALYDAFLHPRATRAGLPLLRPADAFAYAEAVRERVLALLETVAPDGAEPLFRDGFVFGMVAQHEQQHAETLCATLQLAGVAVGAGEHPAPNPPPGPEELYLPGGPFPMGSEDPWALDNERPRHPREVHPFFIDRLPVTNARYAAFIADGGYEEPRLWSPAGWLHRQAEGLEAPLFWRRDGAGWVRERFGLLEPVPPDEPVQHVCWYEAEAFARWAGKRLPTEPEWERAAAGAWGTTYPWGEESPEGRANLGQVRWGPAPAGAYGAGASAEGVLGLLGDVWEWTASGFGPHPGFRAFPYREYSEVFFGEAYKVLRGGSWATSPIAIRSSFRNWDFPLRRQIFAGFRCARDG